MLFWEFFKISNFNFYSSANCWKWLYIHYINYKVKKETKSFSELVLHLRASKCSSDWLWLTDCSARRWTTVSHTHADSKGTMARRDGDRWRWRDDVTTSSWASFSFHLSTFYTSHFTSTEVKFYQDNSRLLLLHLIFFGLFPPLLTTHQALAGWSQSSTGSQTGGLSQQLIGKWIRWYQSSGTSSAKLEQPIDCKKYGRSICDVTHWFGEFRLRLIHSASGWCHLSFLWVCTFHIWRRGGNSMGQPAEKPPT